MRLPVEFSRKRFSNVYASMQSVATVRGICAEVVAADNSRSPRKVDHSVRVVEKGQAVGTVLAVVRTDCREALG